MSMNTTESNWGNETWNTRKNPYKQEDVLKLVADFAPLMDALRKYGLPLASPNYSEDDFDDESDNSKIVCLMDVRENDVRGLVATPSGLVYRFEPDVFERGFGLLLRDTIM